MLQAFSRRKSRLYERYQGHREPGERKVSEEDEITALVMGPLEYLATEAQVLVWRTILEWHQPDVPLPFPSTLVKDVQMHFWPRRTVEPDLLVELEWVCGTRRIILVEFKWNAPLSGKDQLHRQWKEFLSSEERKDALHLFIAPDSSSAHNAISESDVWGERIIPRSWPNIVSSLLHLRLSHHRGVRVWSTQVISFLKLLQLDSFQGFAHLHKQPRIDRDIAHIFFRSAHE
jgi:hypothetical protein